MTGARLTATFDEAELLAAIKRLQRVPRYNVGMMRAIGTKMVENTRTRMEGPTDADGQPWHPLLPAYAEIKRGPGILRASLQLSKSMTFRASSGVVVWGSNKIYAAVHQFGGVIFAKNAPALRFFLGNGAGGKSLQLRQSVTIPARPYLGIDARDRADIIAVVDGFYERALNGRSV